MENEEKIKELEKKQKETNDKVGRIIGILEAYSGFFRIIIKRINRFGLTIAGIIGAIIGLTFSKPITQLFELIKSWWITLSENWQIAMIVIIASLLIMLFGFFLGRKFPQKSGSSKTSQNRNEGDINEK